MFRQRVHTVILCGILEARACVGGLLYQTNVNDNGSFQFYEPPKFNGAI